MPQIVQQNAKLIQFEMFGYQHFFAFLTMLSTASLLRVVETGFK